MCSVAVHSFAVGTVFGALLRLFPPDYLLSLNWSVFSFLCRALASSVLNRTPFRCEFSCFGISLVLNHCRILLSVALYISCLLFVALRFVQNSRILGSVRVHVSNFRSFALLLSEIGICCNRWHRSFLVGKCCELVPMQCSPSKRCVIYHLWQWVYLPILQ